MNTTVIAYFETLRQISLEMLDSLSLQSDPLPLDAIMNRLRPALEENQGNQNRVRCVPKPVVVREQIHGVGLNSIGMLADRFTILVIKEWCLRHKTPGGGTKADNLYEAQTKDIIAALGSARPGSASLNTKITHHPSDADAQSWAEAYYGLFVTNILLWESQEILYIRNIQKLPAEELRSYLKWFSYGNLRRNQFIQLCEEHYWKNKG